MEVAACIVDELLSSDNELKLLSSSSSEDYFEEELSVLLMEFVESLISRNPGVRIPFYFEEVVPR